MRNRFATSRKKDGALLRGLFMPVAFFAVILSLFGWGLGSIGETADAEKLRSTEQSVRRAVVQCYAVEGRYPPDLAYLEKRYGLSVDEERYIVHYNNFADNLMPDIRVLPRDFSIAEDMPERGSML